MTMNLPISFEFYPPKNDEQRAQLDRTVGKLKKYTPEYVSCTFGAGGSTLSYTSQTIQNLIQHHQLSAAPHLSCVGGTKQEIAELLNEYKRIGSTQIVALRGDIPSGMGQMGDLRYAEDLVRFIREQQGDHFDIAVGCYPEIHPQASNAFKDMQHFKAKVDAGANKAITQYFYNADAYFRFVDDVRRLGVTIPIVPGIMPISNFSQLCRFSELCGAEIPRWLMQRMHAYADDVDSIRAYATDVVADLCQRLTDGGAPALHFYTLNLARPTQSILSALS